MLRTYHVVITTYTPATELGWQIEREFGSEIAQLVDGVTKVTISSACSHMCYAELLGGI